MNFFFYLALLFTLNSSGLVNQAPLSTKHKSDNNLQNFTNQSSDMPRLSAKFEANQYGTIVVLGDSFVNISERFYTPLKTCFSTFTQVSTAPGYMSSNSKLTVEGDVRREKFGKWKDVRLVGDSELDQRDYDGGFGPDAGESHSGHKAYIKYDTQGDGAKHTILLKSKPNGGHVVFRSGSLTGKVPTKGKEGLIYYHFYSQSPSIRLVNIGGVSHIGHIVTRKDGWQFHKLGNSGAKTVRYLNIPEAIFAQQLRLLNPDAVVLVLGTNDNADPYTTVADYRRNIVKLTDRIKTAVPHTDLLLFGPNENAEPAAETSIHDYNAVLKNVAEEAGYSFFDSSPSFGTHSEGVAAGLIADIAGHPTAKGGELIGRLLCDNVFKPLHPN